MEKFEREAPLREAVDAQVRALFSAKWGELTPAARMTIDVTRWLEAWETGGRQRQEEARRHLRDVERALEAALNWVAACRATPTWWEERPDDVQREIDTADLGRLAGLQQPMGQTAQLLVQCAPALLRALESIEDTRAAGISMNPSEAPERASWLEHRVEVIMGEDAIIALSRQELATLSLAAGWWPPQAANGSRALRLGLSVGQVVTMEGDLMARARASLYRRRDEALALLRRKVSG